MKRISILACASILLFSASSSFSAHGENAETPPLEFAKLYIDQLAAIEGIRDAAAKELTTDPDTLRLADCVHTMTQYQLELSTQISAMQGVHLSNRFDWLPKGSADFDRQKFATGQVERDGAPG